MLAWLPPPPGDRLWTAFTQIRSLDLTAKPVVRSPLMEPTHDHNAIDVHFVIQTVKGSNVGFVVSKPFLFEMLESFTC